MSDSPQPEDQRRRTAAGVRDNRWPGWIWAVPLAAVAIVVWLVVRDMSGGVSVTVTFENAAKMKANTTEVIYRGIVIGKVSKVSLAPDGSKAVARLRIHNEARKYLRTGTRFYLQGGAPSLSDSASIKAILAGPTIQMVPGQGAPTRSFTGIAGEAPERLAVAIPYRIVFNGTVGDLKTGAPVTLRGFNVGEVTQVELSIDPAQGTIHTATQVALDPLRFHIRGAVAGTADWAPTMNAALKSLIEHHLRARLSQSPPLVGTREVELAVMPDAADATLQVADGLLEIPSVDGGGFDNLVQGLSQFPIREIGANVREITKHIKTLSSAPQLKESIVHLDAALKQLDQTLRTAGPKVAPTLQSVHETVESLKATAGELDKTVSAARALVGNDPAAPDGSLQPTLLHVSEAARAIRELADYLDAHPESLLKGRPK
jgi:paraquat-inducible protein B